MLAWGFGFWMWRLTLARGVLLPLSADCSVVMCGAWPGTLVTWPWRWSSRYDILLYSETLLVGADGSRIWSPCLVLSGQDASGPREWRLTYEMDIYYGAFRQPKFVCGCCEMLIFTVCGVSLSLYVFSLYRSPDLDYRILDCLLTSIAAV